MALIEIKLSNGQSIFAETDEPVSRAAVRSRVIGADGAPADASLGAGLGGDPGGPIDAAVGDHGLAKIDFQAVMATVKGVAKDLSKAMSGLDLGPDSYEISFGVKLSADAGVVFARAGGEASFEVKMAWEGRRRPAADAPSD